MSLISVNDLTFAYDGSYDHIFEHVSFQMDTDWKLGFIGRNGRGKTTYMNLLMKKYEYSGTISANVTFEYFPYAIEDKTRDTIDIVGEINPEYELWELMKELSKLSVADEVLFRPFSTLSNGEQTKVMLAVLFLRENGFLLIDEPTNHLDIAAREAVSQYLNTKKGFILVSHDRYFMDGCVDHILSINRTNIEVQKGHFSSWYHNKQLQDQYELAENERLSRDIKKLKASAAQSKAWADKVESTKIGHRNDSGYEKNIGSRSFIGEKSRRMQQRRKNLERRQDSALDEKSSLLKNVETMDTLKLSPLKYHSRRLVEFKDISLSYDETVVCEHINLEIGQGERIALWGYNGSGKSSLIKLILDPDAMTHRGGLYRAAGLKLSYISQDTSHLTGNLKDYAIASGVEESLFKAILRKMDFSRVQFEKDMVYFSEGQKKKVLIARSLCEQAHLYIWDEPLNFIDVFSRMQIEDLLLEYQPTLLFVEHDQVFNQKVATKVLDLGQIQ